LFVRVENKPQIILHNTAIFWNVPISIPEYKTWIVTT